MAVPKPPSDSPSLLTSMPTLFYLGGALAAAAGLFLIVAPGTVWQFRRLRAKARGLATDESPEPHALALIRLQGVGLIVFGIVFVAMTNVIARGMN